MKIEIIKRRRELIASLPALEADVVTARQWGAAEIADAERAAKEHGFSPESITPSFHLHELQARQSQGIRIAQNALSAAVNELQHTAPILIAEWETELRAEERRRAGIGYLINNSERIANDRRRNEIRELLTKVYELRMSCIDDEAALEAIGRLTTAEVAA